jgi:hypothetical protein
MKGVAGVASPPQQTPPLGFPPLSPARGGGGQGVREVTREPQNAKIWLNKALGFGGV